MLNKKEISLYTDCVLNDVDITYGKLSLVDLRHYRCSSLRWSKRYYQIHCDDNRYPFSGMYDDLSAAVNKFMQIKEKISGKVVR